MTSPTRSALLGLRQEQQAMREGTVFLDEKCLLLAAEIMSQLRALQALEARMAPARGRIRDTLAAALRRHGLNGLQCQPPATPGTRQWRTHARSLLGVMLVDAAVEGDVGPAPPAVNPSPEAADCRAAWSEWIALVARRANLQSNLWRLHGEYRRTARRVRALEDVLLPELGHEADAMDAALEATEQEERSCLTRRP